MQRCEHGSTETLCPKCISRHLGLENKMSKLAHSNDATMMEIELRARDQDLPSRDSTEEMLCNRIDQYLRQLAPHMRDREWARLLGKAHLAIASKQAELEYANGYIEGQNDSFAELMSWKNKLQTELDAANAKIAEADKQEPVGYTRNSYTTWEKPDNLTLHLYTAFYTRPPITSQRELELLAVIEQMREGLDEYWVTTEEGKRVLALTPDLQRKSNDISDELKLAADTITELQDFVIWMMGCGYDFTQHKYFCEQRDKLLNQCKGT